MSKSKHLFIIFTLLSLVAPMELSASQAPSVLKKIADLIVPESQHELTALVASSASAGILASGRLGFRNLLTLDFRKMKTAFIDTSKKALDRDRFWGMIFLASTYLLVKKEGKQFTPVNILKTFAAGAFKDNWKEVQKVGSHPLAVLATIFREHLHPSAIARRFFSRT